LAIQKRIARRRVKVCTATRLDLDAPSTVRHWDDNGAHTREEVNLSFFTGGALRFGHRYQLPYTMTPAERIATAQALLDSYKGPGDLTRSIGHQVISIVLDGRVPDELDADEFAMLLRGLNWTGEHETAFALARNAVRRWGDRFLSDLHRELNNAYLWKNHELLVRADELIEEGLGPAWRWRLCKVHRLLADAVEPSEEDWIPGDRIVDASALANAAQELRLALEASPGISWGTMADLDAWLAPIFQQLEFAELRDEVLATRSS